MWVPVTTSKRYKQWLVRLINSDVTYLLLINLQDITTSKDYFKRKVDYVQEQMDKIDSLGRQKSKVLNAVIDVIEMKVAAIQAQQQQQQQAAK